MKRIIILGMLLLLGSVTLATAEESAFDSFLTKFDYETRADMKIDSKKLITLLAEKKAVLVDLGGQHLDAEFLGGCLVSTYVNEEDIGSSPVIIGK